MNKNIKKKLLSICTATLLFTVATTYDGSVTNESGTNAGQYALSRSFGRHSHGFYGLAFFRFF